MIILKIIEYAVNTSGLCFYRFIIASAAFKEKSLKYMLWNVSLSKLDLDLK